MKRRFALIVLAALASAASVDTTSAQAPAPTSAGTWELNIAKSKSSDPMPKSITRTYEVTGVSEKLTGTIVSADGKTIPIAFTATLDGKDSPFTSPGVDTLVLTKVDPLTISFVTRLGAKQVTTGTRVLSADGRVMTFTQKGTNAAGQPAESTMVYDRK